MMDKKRVWIVASIRPGKEHDEAIPLMGEQGDIEVMTYEEALEAMQEIMLCRASENLFVNLDTGDTEWH